MALFGSLAALRAQAPQSPRFTAAFAYVEDLLRADSGAARRIRGIGRGGSQRVELGDGMFAIEQVYETKPRSAGFFESHRKYIDIQVLVEGDEVMEVVDASRIAVREPYQAERDLITYGDVPDASRLWVRSGEATIFFPVDVHMPTLRSGETPVLVRKTVVKVPVV
jgi:biofilm protein TabA